MQLSKSKRSLVETLSHILHNDFCPGANVYVYWLKEPVGWFLLALVASLLVGAFLSPVGWAIAAGLAVVLGFGLGFPWLATRTLRFELCCDQHTLHEGDQTHLRLKVRNPLPIPVMGLVIENYFQAAEDKLEAAEGSSRYECGLARCPAFSASEYRLPVQPRYRGQYPSSQPEIACSFPFGIYTARKRIAASQKVMVRPYVLPLLGEVEFSGNQQAQTGDGNRPSQHGDFLGVRDFQRGDALRSIHWVQSARLDALVVCERGGPQHSPLLIHLDTGRSVGSPAAARDNLAWRVRIAASLLEVLSARQIPVQLQIDQRLLPVIVSVASAQSAWDQLSLIPLDAPSNTLTDARNSGVFPELKDRRGIAIHARGVTDTQEVKFEVRTKASGHLDAFVLDLEHGMEMKLEQILREMRREYAAA